MPRPTARRPLPVALLAAAMTLGWTAPALACAPAFPYWDRDVVVAPQPPRIGQAGARSLLALDGDQISWHLQVQYYGEARSFGMVVPVPAEPTVAIGLDEVFDALDGATKPTFALTRRTEGTCQPASLADRATGAPMAGAMANNGASVVADEGVQVIARKDIGPYDATTLKAEDAGSLRRWLEANGYAIPPQLDGTLPAYVAAKSYFVAVKLQADRDAIDVKPLVLRYKGAKAGLPVRLASVSAVPDMDLAVYVLGDRRAVPDNYDHVAINEARLDWLDGGANYRQVVTEAMNEVGGRAFVTDYAGPSAAVAPSGELRRRADLDTITLAAKTDGAAFVAHVRDARYFGDDRDAMLAFFRRIVPKAAGYEAMSDAAYYDGAGAQSAVLRATPVDPERAMKEIQDVYIQPAADVLRLLRQHPYLTRLYTTMSPLDMTVDPTFVFNGTMPAVPRERKAEAVTLCSASYLESEAPVRIKLADGSSFMASEGVSLDGDGGDEDDGPPIDAEAKPFELPAARVVLRCGTGAPIEVTDNSGRIKQALEQLSSQKIVLRIRTNLPGTPFDGAGTSFVFSFGLDGLLAQVASALGGGQAGGAIGLGAGTRSGGSGAARPAAGGASAGSGGFGCAGCSANNAPPVQQGAGEGAAYGLFAMGFLGYRRRLGRRRGR